MAHHTQRTVSRALVYWALADIFGVRVVRFLERFALLILALSLVIVVVWLWALATHPVPAILLAALVGWWSFRQVRHHRTRRAEDRHVEETAEAQRRDGTDTRAQAERDAWRRGRVYNVHGEPVDRHGRPIQEDPF